MIKGKNIVAIIPVRGGSKGISRKNSRMLAGKPLLSYSISKGLKSNYIDKVFVTTEDLKLKEIALKFGASVLDRDELLSEDDVTLDEVVVDAIEQIEGSLTIGRILSSAYSIWAVATDIIQIGPTLIYIPQEKA